MDSTKAAVIIPVYKPEFSAYELISLAQCLKVLKDYPIIIVKPQALVVDNKVPGISTIQQISFDDRYFADIHGYNELMLSEEFYSKFSKYEYILIHQLDAFVFSDQLNEWCGRGYDYIGAPWLSRKKRSLLGRAANDIKNYLYVRYNVKNKDGLPKIGKQLENRVGNGGFSLRRVSKFLEHAIRDRQAIDQYLAMKHPWFNEDIFWSIELNRKKEQIKIPKMQEALQFAFETNPGIALELTGGRLPFGCHAWDKYADFWRPFFAKQNCKI